MTIDTKIIVSAESVPHVEIDFMNKTHFEEIEMVNQLGKLITHYQQSDKPLDEDVKAITDALAHWLQHTHAHFERENNLMKETNFPVYLVHSGEHDAAYERMTEIVTLWKEKQDIESIADYVFSLWPAWFNAHVDSMDMITAKFAVMHGYDPHATPQD